MEFDITPDMAVDYADSKKLIKPGRYLAVIESIDDKTYDSGNKGMLVRLKGVSGEAKNVPFFCNVMPAYPPLYLGFIEACGINIDPRAGKNIKGRLDNTTCKGKRVGIITKQEEYDGELGNKIKGFFSEARFAELEKAAGAEK